MADPHIRTQLDGWDKLTVLLYRASFFVAALGCGLLPFRFALAQTVLLTAGALAAGCVHLYLKSFRLVIQFVMWIALVAAAWGADWVALAGALFTLGALSYKEHFCFRVFGARLQPALCALLWLALFADWHWLAYGVNALVWVIFIVIGVKKALMPLDFDIGDKRKYQI